MTQTAIPYLFIRGGTSRGPYFNRGDLPTDLNALKEVLVDVIGAGNPRNIDGVGGGNAVTTKVAMLSPSEEPDVDVDYYFAQVAVGERAVDFGPTCGNILVGVGPAAIEMGIVPVKGDVTSVRIRAVNTGALIEAEVQTPGGQITYSGDEGIDGVPGTAAPVSLNFLDVVGSRTGKMFPTGRAMDTIEGIDVSCVDVAMPMMIARAADLGISGYESADELEADQALFKHIETLRLQAGELMRMGDVSNSVTPKVGLIAPARAGGFFSARYFMPWSAHPTLAITGSQCLAACALSNGTVAEGIVGTAQASPFMMEIEHPMGKMQVRVTYARDQDNLRFISAGVTRTARLIARGEVMLPERKHS